MRGGDAEFSCRQFTADKKILTLQKIIVSAGRDDFLIQGGIVRGDKVPPYYLQQQCRIFKQGLNAAQELCGRCAVHDAVIVGQAQPHHRAGND